MKIFQLLTAPGPLRTFLLCLVLLSAVPYSLIAQAGDIESDWVLLLMWMPGLAALLTTAMHRESFRAFGWRPRSFIWIVFALFAPLLVHIGILLVLYGIGAVPIDPEYIQYEAGLIRVQKTALLFGAEPQHPLFFTLNYVLSFVVGNLLYVVLALGEELGWRGFLQRKLHAHVSPLQTYVVVGLIWGYWHAPGILMGHNFPEQPVLGALVFMPLMTIILSISMGEGQRRTGSVWIAALFHSSFNLSNTIPTHAIPDPYGDTMVYNAVFFGAFGLLAWSIWRYGKRRSAQTTERLGG